MKKLIALFAILVAMTSFSFAENSATASATVKAYTAIEVTIPSVVISASNVLVGGSSTVTFTGHYTYDSDWNGNFSAVWSTSTSGGTWAQTSDIETSGVGGVLVMKLTGATDGENTVTATYTVNYSF
jgi:hypothetical protein